MTTDNGQVAKNVLEEGIHIALATVHAYVDNHGGPNPITGRDIDRAFLKRLSPLAVEAIKAGYVAARDAGMSHGHLGMPFALPIIEATIQVVQEWQATQDKEAS